MSRQLLLTIFALFALPTTAFGDEIDELYANEVQPILAKHCYSCHGVDLEESKLRLDLKERALAGGEAFGPALIPGKSSESPLFQFVSREDADLKMPPKGARLSASEIETLKRWIDAGAKWPETVPDNAVGKSKHWSFQPITKPQVPNVHSTPQIALDESLNEVDRFVLDKIRQHGLEFSPKADRRTLIRRLYLVMLGLPPKPEEVDAFLADQSPKAWENLVDHVLKSPHYGERWGQHWLDVVRFGETNGFETNRERPNAWRYRDYVIQSFNEDKPYDQFIREQLAGDVLGSPLGTGFLVAGPYDLVKSPDISLTLMQRQDELTDMVSTTGTAFLGLTLGCARCHNHKFDPVSQTDFYSLQAIFAGVQHGDRNLPLSGDLKDRLLAIDSEVSTLTDQLAKFIPKESRAFLLIDDEDRPQAPQAGVELLVESKGNGVNPDGTDPGFARDPGDLEHSPNISRGKYTWFENTPNKDVVSYRPFVQGSYRVWISWGAGFETHSKDAKYLLDRDGDLATRDDQVLLLTVDQQQRVGRTGSLAGQPVWSGFADGGVIELGPRSAIVLRGGETGTAITADAICLESTNELESAQVVNSLKRNPPSFRPAVQATLNTDSFASVEAKFVRFTIEKTNTGQPCIDELSVYSNNKVVSLGKDGTKLTCSSELPGYEIHKLVHINDGLWGNDHSWISNEDGTGWVQLELPERYAIDRIEWGRDRNGSFADRIATKYRIEVSIDGERWNSVATSSDRLPFQGSNSSNAPPRYVFDNFSPEEQKLGRAWLAELERLTKEKAALRQSDMAYIGRFEQPPKINRLFRGDPMAPREEVQPNTIAVLGRLPIDQSSSESERRATLAKWVASADNPLTARVWVNRIWQYHFGRGIVDTPNDFGANGVAPTHPELLDYLASMLIERGWSTKQIHKAILLSHTWQQDSRPLEKGLSVDGGTQLLWRFPPRRLEAEGIRDSILSVSGNLDQKLGGPGFDGFKVDYENVRHYFPKTEFGPSDWRRMIYMTKVRMEKESTFGVFDCPDSTQVVPKRSVSTTPLQALNLLNGPFVMTQAEIFAKRLESETSTPEGASVAAQVRLAYLLGYNRPATDEEVKFAGEFISEFGLNQFCRAFLNSNEFLFIP